MSETVQQAVLELYEPHEGQLRLHSCPARFRAAACGRRWGKSLAAVNETAGYSWENTEYPSWWVAPTYRQARKPFNLALRAFKDAIESSKASEELSIVWKSGGRTEFVSAEKYDNLRGEGVGFMVIDEAAFVSKVAFEQVLRPMLSDTMGRLLAIGTPRGKGGSWFYDLWLRGNDSREADYESFHFPTASSPYIAESEIAEVRRILPADTFSQEYEAAFLDDAAGVFKNLRRCYGGFLEAPSPAGRYVMGADLARKQDFTVLTVIDTTRMQVVAIVRFNQISWEVQIAKLVDLARRYGATVLMDTTGVGDPIVEQVRGRGVPVEEFIFTNASKQQLIESLAVTIEHQGIHFPDPEGCEETQVLVDEMNAFQYELTKTRLVRYSAPEGYHDDCVISLALAAWQAEHGSSGNVLLVLEDFEQISPF